MSEVKPVRIEDSMIDRFLLQPGDFLISRSNTLDKVGRIGVYRGGLDNCHYPDLMMRFRPDAAKVNPDYLAIYLASGQIARYIRRHATGTSGSMKKINQAVVEAIPVLLPGIGIQNKIVAVQKTWDRAISLVERLITAKEEQRKWLMQQLLTGKRRLPGCKKAWQSVKIGSILCERKEKASKSAEVPLYSLTIENGITPKTDRYDREALVKNVASKEYKVVYPLDLVFNPSNLRWGAIALCTVEFRVLVSPIYEVLFINSVATTDMRFVAQVLSSDRQIKKFASQTEGTLVERMAVKIDHFLSTKIDIPIEYKEQKAIASVLTNADREIDLLRQKLAFLREQKKVLMQQLLTGKIRVKTENNVFPDVRKAIERNYSK
ncbi:MAG: hypothetical protein M0024_04045 [Nitrospiraceae bacterium]|nr:hypothetical protein [Nitrospiraceae bacterium]